MRSLSAGMQTAITESSLRPVFFVRLEFGASLVVYLNDRAANITWDGQTWLGNGWLRPIKAIDESSEIKATGCEITLTGALAELRAFALAEARLSNKGNVWLGLLDNTDALISEPYLIFSGTLDVPTITTNQSEMTLSLAYESDLRGLERPNEFRFSDQSQKAIYSDDKGFEYTSVVEDWNGYWGKPERPKWPNFRRRR